MALNNCAQFQAINKHSVDGYIYEIIAFEDILMRKDEQYCFPIDFEYYYSSDYMGFIQITHEKQEDFVIKQNNFITMERYINIEIKVTGENSIPFKNGEKLGILYVLKLSYAIPEILEFEDSEENLSKEDLSEKDLSEEDWSEN